MRFIGGTELYSRGEWGADPRPNLNRPMSGWDATYLHHTVGATPSDFAGECREMRSIERIHKGNGWPTVGYTVIVARSGRAFVGFETTRNPWLETRGVHTIHQNHQSLAISLMGNYENLHITPAQDNAVLDLFRYFRDAKGPVAMAGHKDVFATACPGRNAYAQIPSFNMRAADIPLPGPDPTPSPSNIILLEE